MATLDASRSWALARRGSKCAAGLAFSLRTATPNLAVGSIATATGVLGAHLASADQWPLWGAMAMAVLVAKVTGFIASVIVAALSVP